MAFEQWLVGSENDDAVFARLVTSLRIHGYALGPEWTAVAGSQDISHWEVSNAFGTLVVESDTYTGLMVSGSAGLIEQLRNEFEVTSPSSHSTGSVAPKPCTPNRQSC